MSSIPLAKRFNAADHFVGQHLSAGRGNKVAFIDDNGPLSYADLEDQVNRAANAFVELGLAPESRIALILQDSVEFPIVFWGAIKAGLVPIPINTLLTTDNYAYIVRDCRARLLLVSEALEATVQPALADQPFLKKTIVNRGRANSSCELNALLRRAESSFASAETSPDDVAFWLYSSGSTGNPKGVKHLHRNLVCTAETYGREVLGITENDVVFSAAKLFFAYGLGNGMTFPLSAGATVILTAERPTPNVVFDILEAFEPTLYFGVPTLYAAILADEATGNRNASKALRLCVSAGEALPADIGERWQARFGVPIIDGVGSTEMLHIFLSNTPHDVRYGSSGLPVVGYEAKLIDDDGVEVARGEIGELAIAGDSSAEGYWNQRDKSRATFAGKWTLTGDKYYQDDAGYFYICGRTDDMFKSGGNWVSPFDIEASLITHPLVLEAGVVAHADEHGNTKPKAFVVLTEPSAAGDELAAALKEHVKTKLELWKYPRWIEFCDSLPKTATGKIQRFKLRDG